MKRIDILFSIVFLMVVFVHCSDKKKQDDGDNRKSEPTLSSTESSQNQELQKEEHSAPLVIIGESKDALKPYYELERIKEFYELELEMKREEIPTLQVPENLSKLSYEDLRLLRNEIFARNGYLFNDGFLRGYFNKFNWYMPIFDVDTFKIVMSAYEQELVKRIIEEESRRKLDNFTEIGDLRLYNADLVVNEKQFKRVNPIIIQDLKKQNFSIVSAGRQMPFYIYDKNAYQYVPHYITTDLYLFILHKYFSRFLEKLDENHLSKLLEQVLSGVVKELIDKPLYKDNDARSWVEMYAKTALFALTEVSQKVPPQYEPIYAMEKENIVSERGNPLFIKNKEVNYEELKSRGHYTKSEVLKKYFKSFKWISLNGIDLDNNEEFRGFLLLAYILKTEPELYRKYAEFTSIIQKISGVEDNISIKDVISAIDDLSIEQLFQKENLSNLKNELASLNKERVKRVFGSDFPTPEKGKTRIYFLSSTYSISGEIFSRLVHINWEKSKRPFPRGLDIPAVFRNQTAQNIILDEYKDGERWPDYLDSLTFL